MHNADLELQYIPKKTVLVVIQYHWKERGYSHPNIL